MDSKNHEDLDIVRLLSRLARVIRDNRILIISLFCIGALAGLGLSLLVKKQYESRMLLSSEILRYPNLAGIFETIDNLIKERNVKELEKRLKLDSITLSSISSLKTELLIKNDETKPTNMEYVGVKVRTLDNNSLGPFQTSLINYLNNNEFVKARVQQKKAFFQTLIKEVDKEIQSLELLKQNISSGRFFEVARGNIIFDPTTVNSKILDLTRTREEYKSSLELVESIQVIEGFTPLKKPVTGRKLRSAFMGGFAGILIAFAVISIQSLLALASRNEKP